MTHVSIVIPIAGYHRSLANRAIESARAQTVDCTLITAYDDTARGAGYTRNQALQKVTTPFTVFLDADDWLHPTFVQRCLDVWTVDKYVYTDWKQEDDIHRAPECAWTNGTWHVMTTLLPTEAIRKVGGFDDSLPGAEDTDLYLKLTTSGVCGIHLPEALFHYGAEGRRAKAIHESGEIDKILKHFTTVYGGRQMGCCGGSNPGSIEPQEGGLAGDILVMAMWSGNRQEIGRASGRLYERTSRPKTLMVDPRDAAATPHLFQPVAAPLVANGRAAYQDTLDQPLERYVPTVKKANGINEVAALMMGEEVGLPLSELEALKPSYAPDVGKVLRLAKK